jgi:hypothetical protein
MHILSIEHEHFNLEVELADGHDGIAFEEAFLTAEQRHLGTNFTTAYVCSSGKCSFRIWNRDNDHIEEISMLRANYPVFFENISYKFNLDFHEDVIYPSVSARLKSLETIFHMRITKTGAIVSSGVLNFRNEPGHFELILHYQFLTIPQRVSFRFEVYPVKLDFKRDYPTILRNIEMIYPRLVVDYLKKTYHHFELKGTDNSALVWWIIYENLFKSIIQHVEKIIADPHTSLKPIMKSVKDTKVKKVKGKLAGQLEMFIGDPRHHFHVDSMGMMEDNYENRFVKYIIQDILSGYRDVYKKLTRDSSFKRIARGHRIQLGFSADALDGLLHQSFLKDVKPFNGQQQRSMVLHSQPGYVGLIRDWESLHQGYQLLDGLYKMELKDIAYVYQIWCFYGIADLIRQITGVSPEIHKMSAIKRTVFRVFFLQNDAQSKMFFHCPDGTIVELYQELHYTSDFADTDAGKPQEQTCPDIIMRVGNQDQPPDLYQTYIFDAKYRLRESKLYDNIDVPLESDIQQLNNYIRAFYNKPKEEGGHGYKTAITAAYILFPGREAGTAYKKYYDEVILSKDEGGFAFLPYHKEGKNLLKKHLRKLIKEDSKRHLQHILNPEGPAIQIMDAYVIVIPVQVNDATLIETDASQVATLYPIRQLDPAIGGGMVRRVAPYFEGQGIICYYEITAIHIKAWRDIYPPTHPSFRDEGRRYVVLTLKNKVMLDSYVRIKGMANNKRYTQIKSLYSPVDGFIRTVTSAEVLGTTRKSPEKG